MNSTERDIAEKELRQSEARDRAQERHRKAELAMSIARDQQQPEAVRDLAESFLVDYFSPGIGVLIK